MSFATWHKRLGMKISKKSLDLLVLGKFLFVLSLGSIFALDLVRWSYWILIAAMLLIINYLNENIMRVYQGKKISYTSDIFGFIGGLLLVLFFGIQTTQLPFKVYILVVAVILTLPALRDLLKK